MKNWHSFQETADGDDQCGRCATVVTIDALLTFTLACPAGDCPSPANPDRGCVFVPGRGEICACIFCGRPGGRAGELPPTVAELIALPDPEPDDE